MRWIICGFSSTIVWFIRTKYTSKFCICLCLCSGLQRDTFCNTYIYTANCETRTVLIRDYHRVLLSIMMTTSITSSLTAQHAQTVTLCGSALPLYIVHVVQLHNFAVYVIQYHALLSTHSSICGSYAVAFVHMFSNTQVQALLLKSIISTSYRITMGHCPLLCFSTDTCFPLTCFMRNTLWNKLHTISTVNCLQHLLHSSISHIIIILKYAVQDEAYKHARSYGPS